MEEETEKPGRPTAYQVLVRVFRALRGWNREELAAKAGINPKTIYRWEVGKVVPEAASRKKMAEAVGLTVPFVEVCLLPALEAARAASVPFDDETFDQLKKAAAELEDALSGLGRSALGLLAQELENEEWEPWERTGPPCEADRLQAADAWERLKVRDARQRRFLVESCPEFQTWAVAEALCHASEEAAAASAEAALELAGLACRVAELARCEEPWRSRLRGYTLAYLANARRVQTDLREAEEDFARAWKLWQEGAGAHPDLLAEWRLLDREASLRRDERRFAEALDLHARARAAAPREATARILLNKAFTFQQEGESERALATLREAEPLVDVQREPRQGFALRFNLATTLGDLERYSEAAALLPAVKALAATLCKELDQVRVVWLTGKISAGLGRTAEAEAAFEQVRREFTARSMPYDCALVSLELAALHLEHGRTREVQELARQMGPIFQAQGVHREALAALRLFCQAAEGETATVELARQVLRYLFRARWDEGVRFEAGG